MNVTQLTFLLFVLLCRTNVSAQENRIEAEKMISNYRDSVYNYLSTNNAESLDIRFDYLTSGNESSSYEQINSVVYNDFFLALDEIETIYLLQHNFEGIIYILEAYKFKRDRYYRFVESANKEYDNWSDEKDIVWINGIQRNKVFGYSQISDSLETHQGSLLNKSKSRISAAIDATIYKEEVKDFLKVFLAYKIAYHLDVSSIQYFKADKIKREKIEDEYNNRSILVRQSGKQFLEKYPDSEFGNFIREFITKEYNVRKFAFGFDFLLGTMVATKGLADYAYPSFYTALGAKLYYQKVFLNINGGGGINAGKQEFMHDTLWGGMGTVSFAIELGRAINIKDNFSISPIIGVRKLWNTHHNSTGFGSFSPLTFGMEFNLGKNGNKLPYNSISPFLYSGRERSGYHLKVTYQNPRYNKLIPVLNGGVFTITVGANFASFNRKLAKK